MRMSKVFLLAAVGVLAAAWPAMARDRRSPRQRFRDWRESTSTKRADAPVVVVQGTAPVVKRGNIIDWLTDFEEGAKLAAEEKRALMVLFTTEEIQHTCPSCQFAGERLCKTVEDAKVVPVRILPPVKLSTQGVSLEEVKLREEAYRKSYEAYQALLKRFAVSRAPSLVFAAPDAAKLSALVVPDDGQIADTLDRLGELVKAHEEAAKLAGQAGQKDGEPAEGKPAGKEPAKEPAAVPKDEDF